MVNIDFATPETAVVVPQIFAVVFGKLVWEFEFLCSWLGRSRRGAPGREGSGRRTGRTWSELTGLRALVEALAEFDVMGNISGFLDKSVQGFFSFQGGNQ